LKKIYDGEPILNVFSNIGEDVQYRCFNSLYDVKNGWGRDGGEGIA
jgi:hypothetical protein